MLVNKNKTINKRLNWKNPFRESFIKAFIQVIIIAQQRQLLKQEKQTGENYGCIEAGVYEAPGTRRQ